MKIDVVIGANYGDEGKGSVVNMLARESTERCAVVRFNGGAQAGHTVETKDGNRTVFHQLGSGTLQGCDTILSRHHMLDPIIFWQEVEDLPRNKLPSLVVDPILELVTPYDIAVNQLLESRRGKDKHGSCGMGIGSAMVRKEAKITIPLSFASSPDKLKKRLGMIKKHSQEKMAGFGKAGNEVFKKAQNFEDLFIQSANDVWQNTSARVPDWYALGQYDHVIFEGAQGLCLDQRSRDFPYVTHSNTGLANVSNILDRYYPDAEIMVYYVTRCYLTRHGAGPLKGEKIRTIGLKDKTNVYNRWQEELRYAPLDFERMTEEISDTKVEFNRRFKVTAVITCCDQFESARHFYSDLKLQDVIDRVKKAMKSDKVITSCSPQL